MHTRSLTPVLSIMCASAAFAAAPDFALVSAFLEDPRVESSLKLDHYAQRAKSDVRDPIQSGNLMVEFSSAVTKRDAETLENLGCRLERLRGELVHIANIYGIRSSPSCMTGLLQDALPLNLVLTIADGGAPPAVALPVASNPLDDVHELTQAEKAWPLRKEGRRLTGSGVTVCDMDSAIDIYHPALFRSDGGYYSWTDTDGNGVLDVGIDGIDLNDDGSITDAEVLRTFGGRVYDRYDAELFSAGADDLDRTFFFVDENGDGVRNYGPAFGFDDTAPAFGEPLFVFDDVDLDENPDVHEKLIRLGTSKVKGIYTPHDGGEFLSRSERNLTSYDPIPGEDYHGLPVAGIIAGGVLDRSASVGVAPGADFVLFDQSRESVDLNFITQAAWGEEMGCDLFVHEYGTNVGYHADGSSLRERVMDTLSDSGHVQATATHNFSDYNNHAAVTTRPGVQTAVTFEVFNQPGYATRVVYLNIRSQSLAGISGSLTTPSGLTFAIEDGQQFQNSEPGRDVAYYATSETSARGTRLHYAQIFNFSGADYLTVEPGHYTLTFDNLQLTNGEIEVTITDETAYGFTTYVFEDADVVVSKRGTIAWPSTADSAISVGGSVGNNTHDNEVALGLRSFSGRGPRIDGATGVDVIAPTDDFAPAGLVSQTGSVISEGNYRQFGGTSGALPQVSGAIALLLQSEPNLTPAEVKERLHASAGTDALTGTTPNGEWGYGRLNTYRLLRGEDAPANNSPPALSPEDLRQKIVVAGQEIELAFPNTIDPDGDALTFFVDLGYDGEVDQISVDEKLTFTFEQVGEVHAKVRVEDPFGGADEALVVFEVQDAPMDVEEDPEDEDEDEDGELGPTSSVEENPPNSGGCWCAAGSSSVDVTLSLFGLLLCGLYRRRRR